VNIGIILLDPISQERIYRVHLEELLLILTTNENVISLIEPWKLPEDYPDVDVIIIPDTLGLSLDRAMPNVSFLPSIATHAQTPGRFFRDYMPLWINSKKRLITIGNSSFELYQFLGGKFEYSEGSVWLVYNTDFNFEYPVKSKVPLNNLIFEFFAFSHHNVSGVSNIPQSGDPLSLNDLLHGTEELTEL